MSGVRAPTELAELLSLRLGRILKADADYQRMYERRVARLEAMCSASGSISEHAMLALSLTKASQSLAEWLAAEIRATEALWTCSPLERLERVLAWDERVIEAHAEVVPSPVAAGLDALRRKAYDFMRWSVSPAAAGDADRSVEDSLQDYFTSEREADRAIIATIVARLLTTVRTRNTQVHALKPAVQLAHIYRGLLYAGVMNTTGAVLERKQMAAQLRNVSLELASNLFPGLGLLLALAELLKLWEPEPPLAMVENARFVEEYLMKYTTVAQQWMAAAELLIKSLSEMREALEAV